MEQILWKFPNSQIFWGTEHTQTVCTRLFFSPPTHKSLETSLSTVQYSTVQLQYSSKQVHSFSTVIKWSIMYKLCAMCFYSPFSKFSFLLQMLYMQMCRQIIAHVRKCVTLRHHCCCREVAMRRASKWRPVAKSLTCNFVTIWHYPLPVQSSSHVLCSYHRLWLISARVYECK